MLNGLLLGVQANLCVLDKFRKRDFYHFLVLPFYFPLLTLFYPHYLLKEL